MAELNKNILYSEPEIRARVRELAEEITAGYGDDKPIVCVCVLRGAVMFYTDLTQWFTIS